MRLDQSEATLRMSLQKRCAGGPKSKDFWPTAKPFLSNEGLLKDPVIILSEDSNIISDQTSVAGILNDFYVNVANDIGIKLTPEDIETHPSVKTINETVVCPVFSFKPTTAVSMHALIGKSSSKKATGVDGISAKLLLKFLQQYHSSAYRRPHRLLRRHIAISQFGVPHCACAKFQVRVHGIQKHANACRRDTEFYCYRCFRRDSLRILLIPSVDNRAVLLSD